MYWEHATISPVKDDAGKITHYLAVKQNITERKRTEASLQESQQRLRESNDLLLHQVRALSTLNYIAQTLATLNDLRASLDIVAHQMVSLFEVKHWLRRAYKRILLSEEEISNLQELITELIPKLSAYINSIGKKMENK